MLAVPSFVRFDLEPNQIASVRLAGVEMQATGSAPVVDVGGATRQARSQRVDFVETTAVTVIVLGAFLLAAACVRFVKNRIGSIVAFSYARISCVSCVTCVCILLFFFA